MQLPYTDSGTLPPSSVLLALLRQGENSLHCDCLPWSNGLLPDILNLAGYSEINISADGLRDPWTWSGLGNQHIHVNQVATDEGTVPAISGPQIHHQRGSNGRPWNKNQLIPLRCIDALAVCNGGSGVSPEQWQQTWDGTTIDMTTPQGTIKADHFPIWNPLPIARQNTVHIPLGSRQAPWGLQDRHGRQYPVQVVEGPLGREMLVSLHLGPLACEHLQTIDDPVSGAHWEAHKDCLDNGRLRAEFNEQGLIKRLCIDGIFQALSAPLPQPYHHGLPLLGKANVSVLEAGPVRSHIGVTIDCGASILRIDYRLYAGEAILHLNASWQGLDGAVYMELPTLFRNGYLRCGSSTDFRLDPGPSLGRHQAPWRAGKHWAVFGDPLGREGLAIMSAEGLEVQGESGKLRLRHSARLQWALGHTNIHLAQGAESLSCPFLLQEQLPSTDPFFRLCDAASLCAYWIRPHGQGFILLLQETQGLRGRAQIFGLTDYQLWRCNDAGERSEQISSSKEGDAHILPYGAHQVLCIYGERK